VKELLKVHQKSWKGNWRRSRWTTKGFSHPKWRWSSISSSCWHKRAVKL